MEDGSGVGLYLAREIVRIEKFNHYIRENIWRKANDNTTGNKNNRKIGTVC
jgi:hypothetical protein